MTKNKDKFISFTPISGGKVTFGEYVKGKFISKGKGGKLPNYYIDDVLYVEYLNHNLLSISQFLIKEIKLFFMLINVSYKRQ